MKVLMFSDTYGSVTTTFIRNEVNYFSKKHDLIYLAQKIEGNAGDVKTHCSPYVEDLLTRKINWYLWKLDLRCSFRSIGYARQLNDFIRKEKPDVIHCHFAYEALKLLQNIDEEFNIPVFVHFHGYDASQMLRKKSYVTALRNCLTRKNVFPLVVSSKMKIDLEQAGVPMASAEIIRYGIDLSSFNTISEDKTADEITFLQISSLIEKKGHTYTLKAFSVFFEKNPQLKEKVKLIIAGDGEQRSDLQGMVIELGLTKNVSFVGSVNKEEAVKLLQKANIFIHHSITARNGDQEGIPNAIIEAMAMKLPILSTFHAGIPELVKSGVNGLLCEERDVQTYAKQIEEIMTWKKLDVNRAVVEEKYNMEKHNKQLEKMYEERSIISIFSSIINA